MASKIKPTTPPPLRDLPGARGADVQAIAQAAHRREVVERWPQHARSDHQPPPRWRRQAVTGGSTSSAARTVSGKVATIEYDPNGLYIALLHYADGEKRHPRPAGASARRTGRVRRARGHQAGNALSLATIPTGTVVHNVEPVPGQGAARPCRRERDPGRREGGRDGQPPPSSSEVRMVRAECRATVGGSPIPSTRT